MAQERCGVLLTERTVVGGVVSRSLPADELNESFHEIQKNAIAETFISAS
jgi:hypothetical protein